MMKLVGGHDHDGLPPWRVAIGEVELPGLYLVIDREFRPASRTGGMARSR
jgi:hypothetical protein